MLKPTTILIILIVSVAIIAGCSSGNNTLTPADSNQNSDVPSTSLENRHLLGTWMLDFDVDSLNTEVTPNRDTEAHLDVKTMIPDPGVVIRGYDNILNTLDIDITIENPYAFDAFDLRLIIYTNTSGIRLVNPDNWTSLWDTPGGSTIHPFRAFAKAEDSRVFAAYSNHTERIQLEFPAGVVPVAIAIDASWPGNCEEPYMIRKFTQETLYSLVDSWSDVTVEVSDHQLDIADVKLCCPAILGDECLSLSEFAGPSIPGYSVPPIKWSGTLINKTGMSEGRYQGYVKSTSETSTLLALYGVVDISVEYGTATPHNPLVASTTHVGSGVNDIEYNDGYVYAATDNGLSVIDVTDPVEPLWIGFIETPLKANGVVFEDNMAYVATGIYSGSDANQSFVQAFDMEIPSDPVPVWGIQTHYAYALDIVGDYLYVADGNDGLKIIDTTIPAIVGELDTYTTKDVKVSRNYACLATSHNTNSHALTMVNVSDPENPSVVSSYQSGQSVGLCIQDNYVYLIEPHQWRIIDASNPAMTEQIERTRLDWDLRGIAVQGDYVYIAAQDTYFSSWDITDLDNPDLHGRISDADAVKVEVNGKYAYLARENNGMMIVKLW